MSGLSVFFLYVIFPHHNGCPTLNHPDEKNKFYISAKYSAFLAISTSEVTIRYLHFRWVHTDAFTFVYLLVKNIINVFRCTEANKDQ
jgi:hypothetical protein